MASLVIPAYNEANRIEASLQIIAAWHETRPGGWDWEVTLVDDGSTDGTTGIARKVARELDLPIRLLRHAKNRGKGAAIRTGVLSSQGHPVLVSDADLSTPLSEWVKLAETLPTHPVAIGSRALREELVRRRQPFYRRLLGKTGNLLVRLLAVRGIRDTQCGFKLFRGDVARELFRQARINGFACDIEILYLAQRQGLPIAEVPVLWFNSPESKVSFFRDSVRVLWDLVRLRFLHRRKAEGPLEV
ncbi:MAG: dolichyl-phosphate beta-glucosyltransferase [Thermoanaerobaculia bacterium]